MHTSVASQRQLELASNAISTTNRPDHPLVQHLQQVLASAIVLFLNYKFYSWRAHGPLFPQLNHVFDKCAETMQCTFDEIAERLRMIGQDPDVTLECIGGMSLVKQAARNNNLKEMFEEADANAILLIEKVRLGIQIATDANDPGSAAMLVASLREFEKHEWVLRQLLKQEPPTLGEAPQSFE